MTDLGDLVLSNAVLHAFAAALQGVVAVVVLAALPSPSPTAPAERVLPFLLLHLRFDFLLKVDEYLPPIYEAVARIKFRTEVLANLNQTLMRGRLSCCRVFRGRAYFRSPLPLLALGKNMLLWNLFLEPDFDGGGIHSMADTLGDG